MFTVLNSPLHVFFISVAEGLRPAKPHENPSTSGKAEIMTLTPLISVCLDLRPRVFRPLILKGVKLFVLIHFCDLEFLVSLYIRKC
jgi:hypothetical protein